MALYSYGVRRSRDAASEFEREELAIYATDQQRLQYLVCFKLPSDPPPPQRSATAAEFALSNASRCPDGHELVPYTTAHSGHTCDVCGAYGLPQGTLVHRCSRCDWDCCPACSVADVCFPNAGADRSDTLDSTLDFGLERAAAARKPEAETGLLGSSGRRLPLLSMHARAKLLDLIAEVTVVQEFVNDSPNPTEAKFVFALDEGTAVCSFEAFIDDKHVIGKVKEKEAAKKEYKAAVQCGSIFGTTFCGACRRRTPRARSNRRAASERSRGDAS